MLRANCKFIVNGKKAWLPRLKGAVFYYITAAVSRAVSEALKKRFICVLYSVSNKTQLYSIFRQLESRLDSRSTSGAPRAVTSQSRQTCQLPFGTEVSQSDPARPQVLACIFSFKNMTMHFMCTVVCCCLCSKDIPIKVCQLALLDSPNSDILTSGHRPS